MQETLIGLINRDTWSLDESPYHAPAFNVPFFYAPSCIFILACLASLDLHSLGW